MSKRNKYITFGKEVVFLYTIANCYSGLVQRPWNESHKYPPPA